MGVNTGSCGMELHLCFIVVFCLRSTVAQETNSTSTSDFSAADCISYIYVAWVFFIYAVGLGLESSQYPQIITYIYLYIPVTCGGNYEGNDAISAQNLLNILLASTNINGNTFNQNPFSSQLGQNAGTSTDSLIGSLSGIFRSSSKVMNRLKKSKVKENYRKSFNRGMRKLRKDKSLNKYIGKIKNPFDREGHVKLSRKKLKGQINQRNRKIPCKRLAKKKKKALRFCKKLKKRQNKGKKRKRKKSEDSENDKSSNYYQQNPFKI